MKKLIIVFFALVFASCSKDNGETPVKSESETLLATLTGNGYSSTDLQINNSCAGIMTILFSRTDEKMLVYAISDADCNPIGSALNFTVLNDNLIHVFKKGSSSEVFSSLIDFINQGFVMVTNSNDRYSFVKN